MLFPTNGNILEIFEGVCPLVTVATMALKEMVNPIPTLIKTAATIPTNILPSKIEKSIMVMTPGQGITPALNAMLKSDLLFDSDSSCSLCCSKKR